MLVQELIDALELCNPDAVVVVRGYEFGVDDINSIQKTGVVLDRYRSGDYGGPHELSSSEGVPCVYLSSMTLPEGSF